MFKSLIVKNFRNFDQVYAQFSRSVNVFLGQNGQGKTNLLESLYFISTGDSFRFAENENLIKRGESEAYLKTQILHGDFDYDVQISLLKSKKNIFIQGKRSSSSDLIKKFPAIIFSPESLAAIKEGADHRRQLVDQFLPNINLHNGDLIYEFRKCLKTRNRVLRNCLEERGSRSENIQVLESINPQFISLGAELSYQRILAIRALHGDFNNAMQSISKAKDVDIFVEYVISEKNALDWDRQQIEFCLQKRLIELTSAELASGVSLIGPQKHDIRFLYDQNDSRFYCSQGQQRALILSFKMAQIVYHRRAHGAYPVLMLDDVLSELDSAKREALISFLTEIDTQIFITTTDFNLPKDIGKEKCSVIHVTGGKIHDDGAHQELRRGLDTSP